MWQNDFFYIFLQTHLLHKCDTFILFYEKKNLICYATSINYVRSVNQVKFHIDKYSDTLLHSRTLPVNYIFSFAKYDVFRRFHSDFLKLDRFKGGVSLYPYFQISCEIVFKYLLWLGHSETFPDLSQSRESVLDMYVILVLKDSELSWTVIPQRSSALWSMYLFLNLIKAPSPCCWNINPYYGAVICPGDDLRLDLSRWYV